MRKPYQGVLNIVKFNWHFYVLATGAVFIIFFLKNFLSNSFNRDVACNVSTLANIVCLGIILTTFISLYVSYYIYDVSDLYKFIWLEQLSIQGKGVLPYAPTTIANINAGFDETSELLKHKFLKAELMVFDFYDKEKHTEISIERARKAYPPYPNTEKITTNKIPLETATVDIVFLTLAAHEIREFNERVIFFKEVHRILKNEGCVIVTEHLRDLPNFLAFNIGFFHFHSFKTWNNTFKSANFEVSKKIQVTPFVNIFKLEKHGTAS